MNEPTVATPSDVEPISSGATTMQIVLSDKSILDITTPDVQKMLAKPEGNNGLAICTLLASCVVPIRMGVFSIPKKLLERTNEASVSREEMTPVEILKAKREIALFNIMAGSVAACLMSDDILEQFTSEGVTHANRLVEKFMEAVGGLCDATADIDAQIASETAYFRKKNLGLSDMPISSMIISAPIQDFILSLNKLVAGEGGYQIMSAVKSIGRIANFLEDPVIRQLFGAKNKIEMLNKLEYRITPQQIALHENLADLVNLVAVIGGKDKVDNKEIGRLFSLCQIIKRSLR